MLSDFLKKNITSQAKYVEWGYGQVEPNHLSAKYTGQVFAQLPAAADIEILEQGQFVKYDYAKEVVDFDGAGEWMLVFNEIKLYRDHQEDCEFAMLKDNYQARIYSPYDGNKYGVDDDPQSRFYNGVDVDGNAEVTLGDKTFKFDDVTAAPDYYEMHYTEDPFHLEPLYVEKRMPAGTTMVPRVFKTNIGDIFTTNMVDEDELAVEDVLKVRSADGILCKDGDSDMEWQVVKVYTMPDRQRGVKIMRIK